MDLASLNVAIVYVYLIVGAGVFCVAALNCATRCGLLALRDCLWEWAQRQEEGRRAEERKAAESATVVQAHSRRWRALREKHRIDQAYQRLRRLTYSPPSGTIGTPRQDGAAGQILRASVSAAQLLRTASTLDAVSRQQHPWPSTSSSSPVARGSAAAGGSPQATQPPLQSPQSPDERRREEERIAEERRVVASATLVQAHSRRWAVVRERHQMETARRRLQRLTYAPPSGVRVSCSSEAKSESTVALLRATVNAAQLLRPDSSPPSTVRLPPPATATDGAGAVPRVRQRAESPDAPLLRPSTLATAPVGTAANASPSASPRGGGGIVGRVLSFQRRP